MKAIKEIFSLRRHKSDDNVALKTHRKLFSAGSLTNLANIVLSKKSKSVSFLKSNDALVFEELQSKDDKFSQSCEFDSWKIEEKKGENKLKRVRQRDSDQFNSNNNNVTKKMKYEDDWDTDLHTLNFEENDKEFKAVTLRLCDDDILGLEVHPKWTFSSNKVTGYCISRIIPGSAAARSKTLKIGDEIIKINGVKITDVSHFFTQNCFSTREGTLEIIIARPKLSITSDSLKIPTPPTGMKKFVHSDSSEQLRRPKNPNYTQKYCSVTGEMRISVIFTKGPGSKSLGFSVVGGKDSPRGSMGIYIKTVFEHGQAAELGVLKEGDEILSVNDKVMKGLTHKEAVDAFKSVKSGYVFVELVRRNQGGQFRHSF